MIFRASELYEKEVICIKDGTRLGSMSDFEINTSTGFVETIIVYGRPRLFGLLGRDDDKIIPFSCVEVFGEEVILVNCEPPHTRHRNNRKLLKNLFD